VISVTDETIGEYTKAFVSPKLDHVILCLDGLRGGTRDALEDLAHITQVIGVVGFCRSRSEALLDHLVNIDGI
jgi:hypothetical protein